MKVVPSAANSVHDRYTRSWYGLPTWLSTVISGRSRNGPSGRPCRQTLGDRRAGKFHEAPAEPVERKT